MISDDRKALLVPHDEQAFFRGVYAMSEPYREAQRNLVCESGRYPHALTELQRERVARATDRTLDQELGVAGQAARRKPMHAMAGLLRIVLRERIVQSVRAYRESRKKARERMESLRQRVARANINKRNRHHKRPGGRR